MKTYIQFVLALAAAGIASAQESDVEPFATEPTIVYAAPVVYESPVVYQAPVTYEAPVYYAGVETPGPAEANCAAASTVMYIGGGCARSSVNCGSSGSTVIHFGGGQACSHGYYFNHPR